MSSRSNCCVPGCNSVYKNNPELTFHYFPNDGQKIEHRDESGTLSMIDRKKLWEMRLKLEKCVTKNMRVCSRHFSDEDFNTPSDWGYKKRFLKKTAVPTRDLSSINKTALKQKEKTKRFERLTKRREANQIPFGLNIKQDKDPFTDIDGAEALLGLGNKRLKKENFSEFTPIYVKTFVDAATQTDDCQKLENSNFEVKTNSPCISDFLQTDNALNILTGISSLNLLFLLVRLFSSNRKKIKCQKLPIKDRILLVFLKCKWDLTYAALGVLFRGVSVPACKGIFQETVEILSGILANYVYIPSKEEVLSNMPLCFKNYQNVRIALNCTKIRVQMPKQLCCNRDLYSRYRKSYTLKFMTAVTPGGFLAYASRSYRGTAADKYIFKQSQIIEHLIPHVDEIMIDKEFLMGDFCEKYGIKLVRSRKKNQLDEDEASAREHIEKMNTGIKIFRIFRNTFPLHLLPIVDDIFLVICATANLGTPIVKDEVFLPE